MPDSNPSSVIFTTYFSLSFFSLFLILHFFISLNKNINISSINPYIMLMISLFCHQRFFICIYITLIHLELGFNHLTSGIDNLSNEWIPSTIFFSFTFINIIILLIILAYHQNFNIRIKYDSNPNIFSFYIFVLELFTPKQEKRVM